MRVHLLTLVLLLGCGQPPARTKPAPAAPTGAVGPGVAAPVDAPPLPPEAPGPPPPSAAAPGDLGESRPPVEPRFVRDGAVTRQARAVAAALAAAADAGLDPAEYGGGAFADRLRAIDGGRASPEDADLFDADLREAALRFVGALRHGRVRPQALGYALPREPFEAEAFVGALATAADPAARLAGLAPRLDAYDRLVHALPRLRALAEWRRGEPPLRVAVPRRGLRTGEPYAEAARLASLLAALGDLEEPERAAASAEVLSPELAGALRRFQARHALPADGVLGRDTVEALNVPLDRRVAQVELALERWRWMPRNLGRRWVVVNVPAQRLEAGEADAPGAAVAMDVIVGATEEDRRTPVLAARIEAIMFSPYWDVPPRLAAEELAPRLARRLDLAEGDGFFVEVAGARLPVGRRTLALVRKGEARLRQRPGARNSLGPLKVVMPNPSDVYLHGTARPRLFNRNERALSHGCIRVADPAALAAFLLDGQPGWDRARIETAMTRAEPIQVSLAAPASVLLVYATATADEDGRLRFWPDLYGEDARLEAKLRRPVAPAPARAPGPRPARRSAGEVGRAGPAAAPAEPARGEGRDALEGAAFEAAAGDPPPLVPVP